MPFEDHQFAVNQMRGLQVRSVNQLSVAHPLRRARDLQSWLSRLAQLTERWDEAVALTRSAAARGILPPRFILERSRDQIAQLVRPAFARAHALLDELHPHPTAVGPASSGCRCQGRRSKSWA